MKPLRGARGTNRPEPGQDREGGVSSQKTAAREATRGKEVMLGGGGGEHLTKMQEVRKDRLALLTLTTRR